MTANGSLMAVTDRHNRIAYAAKPAKRTGGGNFSDYLNAKSSANAQTSPTPDVMVFPGTVTWLAARRERVKTPRAVRAAYRMEED